MSLVAWHIEFKRAGQESRVLDVGCCMKHSLKNKLWDELPVSSVTMFAHKFAIKHVLFVSKLYTPFTT